MSLSCLLLCIADSNDSQNGVHYINSPLKDFSCSLGSFTRADGRAASSMLDSAEVTRTVAAMDASNNLSILTKHVNIVFCLLYPATMLSSPSIRSITSPSSPLIVSNFSFRVSLNNDSLSMMGVSLASSSSTCRTVLVADALCPALILFFFVSASMVASSIIVVVE